MNQAERAQAIIRLQQDVSNVRNVCVLAHVDHGKTTLSDSLIASNGIISERQAGKVRYLDRREDEQVRGITMEAHAVSLVFNNEHLVNLIDSPGHVDFSADVSSAVRLCDGAFVVVDVVEGVCVQTHAVARIAWEEGLKPCLVLNKIDRLCQELQLTVEEANDHLHRTLEQMNAVLSGFIRAETTTEDEIEKLEAELLFSPEKGNVVFSSGTDAWAFSLFDFAPLIAKVLDAEESVVLSGLWGVDKYWDARNKRVVESSSANASGSPMFAQFVLSNIWQMYETVFAEPPKPKKLANMLEALNLSHVLRNTMQLKDKKTVIRNIMGAWLPCAKALLSMVVRWVPNPQKAQQKRSKKLLSADAQHPAVKAIEACSKDEPLVCFVSKMIAVPRNQLSPTVRAAISGIESDLDDENCSFIALGRVYSGVLRRGHPLYVVGPKGTKDELVDNGQALCPMILMGGDFLDVDEIFAGNVFALAGLGTSVLKTATLSDLSIDGMTCPSLTKMPAQSAALLRVSIEPKDPRDWEKLSKGLKLLNRADPVLEVRVSPTGEHLISAIGELHLERCLKDLREIFAKVDFSVSEPLASFMETLVHKPQEGKPQQTSGPQFWGIQIAHAPLKIVKREEAMVNTFFGTQGQVLIRNIRGLSIRATPLGDDIILQIENGKIAVDSVELSAPVFGDDRFRVLSTNPNGNALILEGKAIAQVLSNTSLRDGMTSGFQFGCRAGPICEEPLRGVAFIVEAFDEESDDGQSNVEIDGGAIVSSFADAVKRAFKVHCEPPPGLHANLGARLVEAIFICSLHCIVEGEHLGNLYSVVQRRRGKITSEDMVDGTSLLQIDALIPVVEAYGIADELRKKTSGNASSPQLIFSHWEVLDVDPFVNRTGEDEELDGEKVEADLQKNIAYRLMISVRKRKGLSTGEKVVAAAEKQRTLSRRA